ncbi:hypothetical protein L0337_15020 [candidate division KSB1 bacterium]|nr:hypothetical protein [candidate division KSB1 bacterium]
MDTNRKFISVISKLNRLTQEGELKWRRMDPPAGLTSATDDFVTAFYGTKYEGRNLGIYEVRYKAYDPDHDRVYWDNSAIVALFTENWQKEWEFPQVAGIWELMRSVEYQMANVDGFVSKILGDEKKVLRDEQEERS